LSSPFEGKDNNAVLSQKKGSFKCSLVSSKIWRHLRHTRKVLTGRGDEEKVIGLDDKHTLYGDITER
ncbi:Hypothetical predicted protein, partial [Scomber scombrus]